MIDKLGTSRRTCQPIQDPDAVFRTVGGTHAPTNNVPRQPLPRGGSILDRTELPLTLLLLEIWVGGVGIAVAALVFIAGMLLFASRDQEV